MTFEYNQRGHQVFRVIEIDAATGRRARGHRRGAEDVLRLLGQAGTARDIARRHGRSCGCRSATGGITSICTTARRARVKNQITKGEWVVRGVDASTRPRGRSGSARAACTPGKDPYFVHYYRINFDGTGLTTFTEADGNHARALLAGQAVLRRHLVARGSAAGDGAAAHERSAAGAAELENGDMHARCSRPAGGRPKSFVAKGRDGKTDIWGVIVRPTNFDPTKKYPVIENIYAGPHGSFVPKTFGASARDAGAGRAGLHRRADRRHGHVESLEGVPRRRWKNLGDAGFPDRILWHKAVAAKYPYYDITRVGHLRRRRPAGRTRWARCCSIPSSTRSRCRVAGCHDNRMDKIWWNEQWMGWPVGPHYAASSNVDNAARLQGQAAAGRRRAGHERRSGVDDAGGRTR